MTIEEYSNSLQSKFDGLLENFFPLKEAVQAVKADISKRVFEDSINTDGGKMLENQPNGAYSTTPIYVSSDSIPRKTGKNIGKRGVPIKSEYFSGGYAEMKSDIDRRPAVLFGFLRSDFNNSDITGSGTTFNIELTGDFEAEKAEWVQKKYGVLFRPNQEETEKLYREIAAATIRYLNS